MSDDGSEINENIKNEETKEELVYHNYYEEKIYTYVLPLYISFIKFIYWDELSLGPIATFYDSINKKEICIKKIEKPCESCPRAKKVLKLTSLLTNLNHPNIVKLNRIYIPNGDNDKNYDTVYLFYENFPSNLERLIESDYDYLSDKKIVPFIIYQILKGLFYIHSSGIIHRYLRPSNILINDKCQIKICGFGNSVYKDFYENYLKGETNDFILEKICLTHMSPEQLASKKKSKEDYDEISDLWSVGCILVELLTKIYPFFPPVKKNKAKYESEINGIFSKLGKPPKETFSEFASKERAKTLMKFKNFPKMDSKKLYPNVSDKNAIDLIEKLLCINPKKRINILEAKDHPYFDIIKEWKKPDDFIFKGQVLSFPGKQDIEKMEEQNEFYNKQIDYYRNEIRMMRGEYDDEYVDIKDTFCNNLYTGTSTNADTNTNTYY